MFSMGKSSDKYHLGGGQRFFVACGRLRVVWLVVDGARHPSGRLSRAIVNRGELLKDFDAAEELGTVAG
jgi:hypothetical protein